MEAAASHAPAADAADGPELSHGHGTVVDAPDPAANEAGGSRGESPAAATDAGDDDLFRGRPDLSQDAITDLRLKQKSLKQEQKRIRAEMKNKKRRRARLLQRMRHLDTASVLQALMERGLDFAGTKAARAQESAASSAASPSTGPSPSKATPPAHAPR